MKETKRYGSGTALRKDGKWVVLIEERLVGTMNYRLIGKDAGIYGSGKETVYTDFLPWQECREAYMKKMEELKAQGYTLQTREV